MPSVVAPGVVSVDREWAESLIGLRMRVPESWWVSYTSNNLCPCRISAIDFSDEHERFFVLQPDNKEHDDAVITYTDEADANHQGRVITV